MDPRLVLISPLQPSIRIVSFLFTCCPPEFPQLTLYTSDASREPMMQHLSKKSDMISSLIIWINPVYIFGKIALVVSYISITTIGTPSCTPGILDDPCIQGIIP